MLGTAPEACQFARNHGRRSTRHNLASRVPLPIHGFPGPTGNLLANDVGDPRAHHANEDGCSGTPA